jgi:hypothetical protein
MDFVFLSAVCNTGLLILVASYDIACQWMRHFAARMKQFLEYLQLNLLAITIQVTLFMTPLRCNTLTCEKYLKGLFSFGPPSPLGCPNTSPRATHCPAGQWPKLLLDIPFAPGHHTTSVPSHFPRHIPGRSTPPSPSPRDMPWATRIGVLLPITDRPSQLPCTSP